MSWLHLCVFASLNMSSLGITCLSGPGRGDDSLLAVLTTSRNLAKINN